MQRNRGIVLSGRAGVISAALVTLAGWVLVDSSLGQANQRYTPRGRTPTPAARERNQYENPGSDVTRLPTAPMPSLRSPSSIVKTPADPELQDGEILVDENGKLPQAQEVNPGNVLVKEAFKKSESAKNEGDYSEVIALCEEGIKSGANKENAAYARKLCAWAYNRRGERFAELGNEQEAMKDFTSSISYDAANWRAIHNRGVSNATLGRNSEAMADFSRALQINRAYANTWFNRAELLADGGDYGRALRDYSEAIRLSPKEPGFYAGRGRASARLGRIREAMEDLNMAIRLDPDNALARVSRAEIYAAARDWGRAAADYRDAIQLDDKLGSAYQGAAWIMSTCPDERYRNDELALTAAQKALELDGDKDPRYVETLAAAYANAGQFDSAVAILQSHLERMPQQYVAGAQARIQLYKSERPYRAGPPTQGQSGPQQTRTPTMRQPQPRPQQQPVRRPQQATRDVTRAW